MGFVVDVHELTDGGVGVFLRGGEGLVAEEFLNGAEVGAVSEKMGGEGVTERVRVKIPVYVNEANVFFDDAADGTLREAVASVVEEDGVRLRRVRVAATLAGGLCEQLIAKRPIAVESFVSF